MPIIDSGLRTLAPSLALVRHRVSQPSCLYLIRELNDNVGIRSTLTASPGSQTNPSQPTIPSLTHTPKCAMSSDEAYSAFLDQANQDTGASDASTQSSHPQLKATDTDIPATLQNIDQTYTSEADEPFEPVSLKWTGRSMPSESMWFLCSNCESTKPQGFRSDFLWRVIKG